MNWFKKIIISGIDYKEVWLNLEKELGRPPTSVEVQKEMKKRFENPEFKNQPFSEDLEPVLV